MLQAHPSAPSILTSELIQPKASESEEAPSPPKSTLAQTIPVLTPPPPPPLATPMWFRNVMASILPKKSSDAPLPPPTPPMTEKSALAKTPSTELQIIIEALLYIQVLKKLYDALTFIGDSRVLNQKWLSKFKCENEADTNTLSLAQLVDRVLAKLDDMIMIAREMFDVMDDNGNESNGSPRNSEFVNFLDESYSDSKTSNCHLPVTPTSVLPEFKQTFTDCSYSPPLLWPLRLQAVDKLKPVNVKCLSFHVFPLVASRSSSPENERKTVSEVEQEKKRGRSSSGILILSDKNVELENSIVTEVSLQVQTRLEKNGSSSTPHTTVICALTESPSKQPEISSLEPPKQPTLPAHTNVQQAPTMPQLVLSINESMAAPASPPIASPNRFKVLSPSLSQPLPVSQTNASTMTAPRVKQTNAFTPLPPPMLLPSKGSAPPPPPPPILCLNGSAAAPPPPPMFLSNGSVPSSTPPMPWSNGPGVPPPPPGAARSLCLKKANTKLKRSSHMGNLYRVLKGKVEGTNQEGKDSSGKKNVGASSGGSKQSMADAIAEMTKRSSYFQQIEEDIQNHSKAIMEMRSAINSFQATNMNELNKFHRYVESHLEKLIDETQVLARFENFPTKKLETLRTAAAMHVKLDAMLTTLNTWKLDPPVSALLDRVENYFKKIKEEVDALDRTKDEEAKRFQSHKIPFDFHILVRIKESMVDLSSSCMELALKEKREAKAASDSETVYMSEKRFKVCTKILWRAFQLAFRVYTFAGGHDDRADMLARELAHEIENDLQH